MTAIEFGNLVTSHSSFLEGVAIKFTKDREEASDLTQDTYLKALSNREKYRPGTNIKGWLYTIMKNTFINQYRKRKTRNTFSDETENQFFINQKEAHKDSRPDSYVDREEIEKVVDNTDPHYVDSFMMHFEGFKYEEIAEILGIPLGTVKSRIFLARKKLMAQLVDYRY
jgi:RNA polymerase sigma-70 factor (ECF subfamily)